jgi:membrane protease YdiL (CAAX protease family)
MNVHVHPQRDLVPGTAQASSTALAVLVSIALLVDGYLSLFSVVLLLPFIGGLYGLMVIPDHRRLALAAVLLPTILAGLCLAIYRPSGFEYPLIWNPGPLYEGGSPFALYVNLSKAVGGYLMIIWLMPELPSQVKALLHAPPARIAMNAMTVVLAISLVLVAAAALFDVGWQTKLPDGILYFVTVNLLVTVVSEEAFFRLLIQRQVMRFFQSKRLGISVGLGFATVLFAIAHSGAKGPLFILFLLAGFVYAAVYARTKSLLASIAAHFGVNFAHILLLEYPL